MRKPTERLLREALDVINRTLAKNRHRGLFGRALAFLEEHMDGHVTAALVYQDDPRDCFDAFTVRYRCGRFDLVDPAGEEHESEWKVSRAYLEAVVSDPELYVERPWRLDLDWLADRIPDPMRSPL